MKFQNSVNALSEAWNFCTAAASSNVGGCSTNEISGNCLPLITRISSQITVVSSSTANTAEAPTNTLAKALAPGWNGSVASCRIWNVTATTTSASASSAKPDQADLRPALSCCRPNDWAAALTTTAATITAPSHACGPVKPAGCHRP